MRPGSQLEKRQLRFVQLRRKRPSSPVRPAPPALLPRLVLKAQSEGPTDEPSARVGEAATSSTTQRPVQCWRCLKACGVCRRSLCVPSRTVSASSYLSLSSRSRSQATHSTLIPLAVWCQWAWQNFSTYTCGRSRVYLRRGDCRNSTCSARCAFFVPPLASSLQMFPQKQGPSRSRSPVSPNFGPLFYAA